MKKYEQIAYDEAKQSNCRERQVGCVIVDDLTGEVLGQGHNYSTTCSCNDSNEDVECPEDVVHAEIAALSNVKVLTFSSTPKVTIYITQPPCNNCIANLQEIFPDGTFIICEQFLKFDSDKLRFDLIPPEWEEEDAKVLTYGAIKYKPNNWRKGEIERYKGAVMRHRCAYRKGEWLDPETGLSHLSHMRTNVGFLFTLEEQKNENNDD